MKVVMQLRKYLLFAAMISAAGSEVWAANVTYNFGGVVSILNGSSILQNGGAEHTAVSGTIVLDSATNNGEFIITAFDFLGSPSWDTTSAFFTGGPSNQLFLDYQANWDGNNMEMGLVLDATGLFGGTGAVPASDAVVTPGQEIGPSPIATTTKDWDPQVGIGSVTDDGVAGGVINGAPSLAGFSFNLDILTVVQTACDLGACSNFPVMPASADPGAGFFIFNGVGSGLWVDPPEAFGYEYAMTDGSLFTEILNFPGGFNSLFQVEAEGTVLGLFGPAESVDFTALLGHGVSQFKITGIDPGTDPSDPGAFPIQLAFNTATASFSMQSLSGVPIPATVWLFGSGLVGLAGMARRRKA